jgi:adenylate cyclase
MSERGSSGAWLELPDGKEFHLPRTCSIGRSHNNTLVLAESRVSRRHALIQIHGEEQFMVVDFGSANGTRVNERRIAFPTELKDGNVVDVGGIRLVFRQQGQGAVSKEEVEENRVTTVTVREVRLMPCWLLVSDMIESTALVRTVAPDELPILVGKWFSTCRELVEMQGGVMSQYTGDGFLAYWTDAPDVPGKLSTALKQLCTMQGQGPPQFRWVSHLGQVSVSGAFQAGEETLMGKEVHFVFRMEALSKALCTSSLLSGAGAERLRDLLPLREVGEHTLKGFEGKFAFYSCSGEP